jgi:hypothetical protein
VCRWTGRIRPPCELSGCALCPVLIAATCPFVCLSTCHKSPSRFIVIFCTGSLWTHPKFVLKWASVLLLLKCANFDIEHQQRTVLLSLCVQCHSGAVLAVRSLPKYFSERRLLETQKLLEDSDRRLPTQFVFPYIITDFEITTLPKSSGQYMYHQV